MVLSTSENLFYAWSCLSKSGYSLNLKSFYYADAGNPEYQQVTWLEHKLTVCGGFETPVSHFTTAGTVCFRCLFCLFLCLGIFEAEVVMDLYRCNVTPDIIHHMSGVCSKLALSETILS